MSAHACPRTLVHAALAALLARAERAVRALGLRVEAPNGAGLLDEVLVNELRVGLVRRPLLKVVARRLLVARRARASGRRLRAVARGLL